MKRSFICRLLGHRYRYDPAEDMLYCERCGDILTPLIPEPIYVPSFIHSILGKKGMGLNPAVWTDERAAKLDNLDGKLSDLDINPWIHYAIGDSMLNPYSSAVSQTESTSYVKIKEIKLWNIKSATYRTSFEHCLSPIGGTGYARIYKNGVAFGTERSNTTATWILWTEDLAFTVDNLYQMYAYSSLGGGRFSQVKNFGMKGKWRQPEITLG